MLETDFHIAVRNQKKMYFRISEKATNLKLILLPFEHYHKSLYGIIPSNSKYEIPSQTIFSLEEVSALHFPESNFKNSVVKIQSSVSKEEYISNVEQIKKHIQRGDIYEMNYCFEFFAENAEINPLILFDKLYEKSLAPFSSLTKIGDLYLICCSPERFLKRFGNKIISQPMKGTAPRHTDVIKDAEIKNALRNNPKEQNENVMIVDLVRNDLSRIAKRGTVEVEELFGIESFATVHQMISTISCINNNHSDEEIFRALFPMGSMTGAPKKRTLELIKKFEKNARGIYSGTIGIREENGDFDLAVIIRSIVYDAKMKYLSFSVGSAITANCNPESEYEECLLKAQTMMQIFKS